jgi:hypothetical protein
MAGLFPSTDRPDQVVGRGQSDASNSEQFTAQGARAISRSPCGVKSS